MTNTEIEVTLAQHDTKIKECADDITELKSSVKTMNQLVISVERMTVTLENMVHTQEQTNDRLTALEKEPADNWKLMNRTVLTGIVSALVGAAIAAAIANL